MKFLFLFIFVTGTSMQSFACKCISGSFRDEVKYADQIFIGTVLKKDTSDGIFYLFRTNTVFKGPKNDTVTIRSGYGGPDCGIVMETGKAYLVFAVNNRTDRCGRTSLAENHTDIARLQLLFDSAFAGDIGKNDAHELTQNEAWYFNKVWHHYRDTFDFNGKRVAFYFDNNSMSKSWYFTAVRQRGLWEDVLILTPKENALTGYDVVIAKHRNKRWTQARRRKVCIAIR